MELDASCNEITHLPRSLGQLKYLKALDLRKNLLVELPIELTYLKLTMLDMSENRISILPVELRQMTSLEQLKLNGNPLVSPPATVCMRGRVHIFKFLETQVNKTDKKRCGTLEDGRRTQRKSDVRYPNGVVSEMRSKRHTVDSGYSTSDGMDLKWAQDFNKYCDDSVNKGKKDNIPSSNGDVQDGTNGALSGSSTPSTISPGEYNFEEEAMNKTNHLQIEAKRLIRLQSNDRAPLINKNKENPRFNKVMTNGDSLSPVSDAPLPVNGNSNSNSDEKKPLEHIQTYREYKEALRLQRAQTDVYRQRLADGSQQSPTTNENYKLDEELNAKNNLNGDTQIINSKKPVQKVIPSRNANYTSPYTNGGDTNQIPNYVKPSSPVKGSTSLISGGSPRQVTATLGHTQSSPSSPQSASLNRFRMNSGSPRPVKWNNDVLPDKLSFTMRREFEKAKEEAELLDQLRNHIESRLKMSLPEDIGPALMDGVVLCHLANHVRPRSVASIHVPSPAVHGSDSVQTPKLTMARCRRNVDNFLDACRKIGVEEEDLCSCEDVVETLRVGELLHTVESFLYAAGTILPLAKPAVNNSDNIVSTLVCLVGFFATVLILFFFPPPN